MDPENCENPKLFFLKQLYHAIKDAASISHDGSCENVLLEVVEGDICPSCGKESLNAYAWVDGESYFDKNEIMIHYGERCNSCSYGHHEHVTLDTLLKRDENGPTVYDLDYVRVRMYPKSWIAGFENLEWDELGSAGFSTLSGEVNLHFFDETRMFPLIISRVGYKSCSFQTLIDEFAPRGAKELLDRWKKENKSEEISVYLSVPENSYEPFTPLEMGVWYLNDGHSPNLEKKLVEFPLKRG